MKFAAVLLATLATATAFAPASFATRSLTMRFAEPEEEEEGGLDLDLGEMFEM
jgi:hypothetical protein